MEVIDGNAVAEDLLEELASKIQTFEDRKPCVVFIRVGEDPASVSYVRKKEKTAAEVGIESRLFVYLKTFEQRLLQFRIPNKQMLEC